MIRVIVLIAIATAITSLVSAQINIYRDLAVDEFKELSDSLGVAAVIIDLRTMDEIKKEGMIPGAIQIDYFGKNFEKQIGVLEKNVPVFLYCAGGGRSSETSELMRAKGFSQVYNLKHGFSRWEHLKMPITPYKR